MSDTCTVCGHALFEHGDRATGSICAHNNLSGHTVCDCTGYKAAA